MLYLKICFEKSWTNAFRSEENSSYINSSSDFNDQLNILNKPNIANMMNPEKSVDELFLEYTQQIKKDNPSSSYHVVSDFQNTVLGTIARLMGQIERLSELKKYPFFQDLEKYVTYTLHIDSVHSEIVFLKTKKKDLPTSGAGILTQNHPFFDPVHGARIFGHLQSSLDDMLDLDTLGTWYPKSIQEIISGINAHKDDLKMYPNKEKLDIFYKRFEEQAIRAGIKLEKAFLDDKKGRWNIAGARAIYNMWKIEPELVQEWFENNWLSNAKNISGLAMDGSTGQLTVKDLYNKLANKAYSYGMPYMVDMKVPNAKNKTDDVTLGAILKNGYLEIEIPKTNNLDQQVHDYIQAAQVGPFQFGKKGIAYIVEYQKDDT